MDEFNLDQKLASNNEDRHPSHSASTAANKPSLLNNLHTLISENFLKTGFGLLLLLLLTILVFLMFKTFEKNSGHLSKSQEASILPDDSNEYHSALIDTDNVTTNSMDYNNGLPDSGTSSSDINSLSEQQKVAMHNNNIKNYPTNNTQQNEQLVSVHAQSASQEKMGLGSSIKPKTSPLKQKTVNQSTAQTSSNQANYTLQLSGASKRQSLEEFAKKIGLTNYHIRQTKHDGKPWFILVSGQYATREQAKQAITSLPNEAKLQKPWIRPDIQ